MRERWGAFAPTVALVEGDLGMLFPAFMDPVETFGETGLVHALARADGVRTWSWEPPLETMIRSGLDQGFTREQVALRWILNPYFSNLRHGRPADPRAFVQDTLRERSGAPGLAGALSTLDDVEVAWARAFPQGPTGGTSRTRTACPASSARSTSIPRATSTSSPASPSWWGRASACS